MALFKIKTSLRQCLLNCALIAFVCVRAIVPTGYMLSDGSTSDTFMLCHGNMASVQLIEYVHERDTLHNTDRNDNIENNHLPPNKHHNLFSYCQSSSTTTNILLKYLPPNILIQHIKHIFNHYLEKNTVTFTKYFIRSRAPPIS